MCSSDLTAILLSLCLCAWRFQENGYLPQPFYYRVHDSLMDLFTTARWANIGVAFEKGALIAEYNLTPKVGLRLAPEYFPTGFGSTFQNSLGFTASIAYRFGKR